jgi:hyperosmotically inducible protein
MLKTLVFLMLLVPLAGCTALLVGGAAAGGYYVGKDERTAGEIAEDANITATVKTRFIADDIVRARDINVDTFRKVVTLRGVTVSREAKDRAIEIARGVNKVENVIADELVIGEK